MVKATTRNQQLADLYRTHPLRMETILARVKRNKTAQEQISQYDLSTDPVSELTDQNHIGGWAFNKALAEAAQISSTSRVLDLGCGLGGSARYLATVFGCSVVGVDIVEERCTSARYLTELVHLSHLVTIRCGDITTIEVCENSVDVLWSQGALTHIVEKRLLIHRWCRALKKYGRFAVEDAFMKAVPSSAAEKGRWSEVESLWQSTIVPLDMWSSHFRTGGCSLTVKEDISSCLAPYIKGYMAAARRAPADAISLHELTACEVALELATKGLLGYFRLVAEKR